jgi:DNA mismatch repair protein MutS
MEIFYTFYFIPAKKGKIGIFDSIFTRIGSGDALAKGLSTFMVEMLEVSNILNNATERSFIVLDEVGRGTSTYDGLSIAWAISEFLAKKVKAKVLFATHYHELVQLENEIKGVKNFHMKIKEDGDEIRFLYRVVEGFSNKSYGIHVAKLAGIKEEIIKRAYEVLYYFEEGENPIKKTIESEIKQPVENYNKTEEMLPLFQQIKEMEQTSLTKEKLIIEELEKIDIGNITPVEALLLLSELKKKIKE